MSWNSWNSRILNTQKQSTSQGMEIRPKSFHLIFFLQCRHKLAERKSLGGLQNGYCNVLKLRGQKHCLGKSRWRSSLSISEVLQQALSNQPNAMQHRNVSVGDDSASCFCLQTSVMSSCIAWARHQSFDQNLQGHAPHFKTSPLFGGSIQCNIIIERSDETGTLWRRGWETKDVVR